MQDAAEPQENPRPGSQLCLHVTAERSEESRSLANAVCTHPLGSNHVVAGAFLGICTF